MQKIPKVAIITRTRNRNRLLGRAIKSVLGQSMADWHHIIVNDGGNSSEVEKLCASNKEAYAGRLTVLNLDHVGMQSAANEAIAKSKSTYLAIHDDDDAWHEDFLKETTSFLDELGPKSKYQGVISKTMQILEEEQKDGSFKEIDRKPYVPLENISMDRIGYQNPFPPIAFLYRRSVHKKIGHFKPEWDLVADMDFNFRFLQEYEVGVVDKKLAYYHWRTDDKSSDNANTVTSSKRKHAILYNELKNHYLRDVSTIEGSSRAITFLLSAFGVENQWMTSEVRERSNECQEKITHLLGEIQQLRKFNDESVWPKLEKLENIVRQADTTNNQLEEVRRFNNDTVWPKLKTITEKGQSSLEQLEIVSEAINKRFGQLEKLGEAIDKRFKQIEALGGTVTHRLKQLETVGKTVEQQSSQLETVRKTVEQQSEQLKTVRKTVEQQAEQSELFRGGLDSQINDLDASNKYLSSQFQKIHVEQKFAMEKLSDEQQSQTDSISGLQKEVERLRVHQGKHWKIGRLKFTWMDSTREKDSKDNFS